MIAMFTVLRLGHDISIGWSTLQSEQTFPNCGRIFKNSSGITKLPAIDLHASVERGNILSNPSGMTKFPAIDLHALVERGNILSNPSGMTKLPAIDLQAKSDVGIILEFEFAMINYRE
jgi:hypothetical protein